MPGTYKKIKIYPYFGIDLLGSDNFANTSFRES